MEFTFEEIEGIQDPLDRTKAAHERLGQFQEAVTELTRLRREGVEQLQAAGWKPTEIAVHLGVTRQRVEQIGKNGPTPARAFLGRGNQVIIAVGEKTEAPKEGGRPGGPAVATEDLVAYETLSHLARDLKMDVQFEGISPPGLFDTNRENLIVACGPRLSPVVAQLLAGDPCLGFSKDDQGWYLVDRDLDEEYRSPSDRGVPADYAYLGRLPRLDGKGSFLYMGGIHSAGAAGAAHWITNNLSEIYSAVGAKGLFSTLIKCEYSTSPLRVTSSERVSPIYRREVAS
ncbi:sigma-70 family RNA polymerase sigma factor [Nocardiopsis alba]|uniref:sigma-70 family RNA polymerase sigma factor n=2 Tax=Nocardiopsis alba TaxID=53437 RepID=UPI003671C837